MVKKGPVKRGPTKYTSFGVSFDEIDRLKEEAKMQQKRMELSIENMIDSAKEQGRK